MNDVRQWIFGAIIGLLACIGLMLGIVYVSACGFTLTCVQASPLIIRTPIPTLIPVSHDDSQVGQFANVPADACRVLASELIAAWAVAGHTESEPFYFTDLDGRTCQATFEDIQPLFVENNVWHASALGCTSCHNANLTDRSSGLDLSSYEAISMGTRRVQGATSPGTDLFGRGDWEKSILYDVLFNQGLTAEGHSPDVAPPQTIVFAGHQVAEIPATSTPGATATVQPTATAEATAEVTFTPTP